MVKFGSIIEGSIEWTRTVLFRPFQLKKWLILGFLALMAGYAGSGFNLNIPESFRNKRSVPTHVSEARNHREGALKQHQKLNDTQLIKKNLKVYLSRNKRLFMVVFIFVIAVGLLVVIISSWLWSRFSLIFLQDVVNNDASVRRPFKEFRAIGNSLFLFFLVATFISLAFICVIVGSLFLKLNRLGLFSNAQGIGFLKILFTFMPYLLLLLLLFFIMGITMLIINDFTMIIMLKEKIKIIEACKKTASLAMRNKSNLLVYLLLKICLSFCSGLIYSVVLFIALIGFLIPSLAVAALLYFIYKMLPNVHIPSFIYMPAIFIITVPLFIFLWYCLMCLYLPFAVFLRTFSVKFLGRIAPEYDLFRMRPELIER